MAYSKRKQLVLNLKAIRLLFTLEKENRKATKTEKQVLRQFGGFGGLKFILNPVEHTAEINYWVTSERHLFGLTQELYGLLRDNTTDERDYRNLAGAMKNSVLSSFYTPPLVVDAISEVLKENGISLNRFLEPSAGTGNFIESFTGTDVPQVTAYEKDLLTGRILKQLYPGREIHIESFSKIPQRENGTYDMVASNIPFGDIALFDPAFSKSKDPAKVQAAQHIHNYFFLKGSDMLREGGILAYITSQGVLNSAQNKAIRKALMKEHHLVSAIRLPNNLFKDYAGTEVGSDLIVLQKDSSKQGLSSMEELFCTSYQPADRKSENMLLGDPARAVHTKFFMDTDPYGQPALVYEHAGGTEGIATDLKKMLNDDLSRYLDLDLYNRNRQTVKEKPAITVSETTPKPEVEKAAEQPENIQLPEKKEPVKTKATKKKDTTGFGQLSLFDQPEYESLPTTETNIEKQKAPVLSQPEIAPFSGELHPFYKEDCLVVDNGYLGQLTDVDRNAKTAVFHPLKLSVTQTGRAKAYIALRDAFLELSDAETRLKTEQKELREQLNARYDDFVRRYRYLNSPENIKLIKTDPAGMEMPYLERTLNGVVRKADIFHRPVSFTNPELKTGDASEALVSSLNKYWSVNLDYMAEVSGLQVNELLAELKERLYFNPFEDCYEIGENWISGNVVDKAQQVRNYLKEHPEDKEAKVSLKALEDARPIPITFEELDFYGDIQPFCI